MKNPTDPITILNAIRDTGLISILRGIHAANLCDIVEKMGQEGVRLVEVTLDTPDALQSIQKVSRAFSGEMIVGAGTVLDREAAQQAIAAGARFVLSPTLDTSVIDCCGQNGVLPIPGVFSPSEIASAKKAGAVLVKVFPASLLGTGYIERMRSLFGGLEFLAVGGIDLSNVAAFIASGAMGVGIGSQLASKAIVDDQDYELLGRRVAQFLQKIQAAKSIV